jgi:hypothetical protein
MSHMTSLHCRRVVTDNIFYALKYQYYTYYSELFKDREHVRQLRSAFSGSELVMDAPESPGSYEKNLEKNNQE